MIEGGYTFFMGVDYVKKSKVLKTDLCKRINAIDRETFVNAREGVIFDQSLEDKYFDVLNEYGLDNVQEARKINKASFYRVERLKERITTMLTSGTCIWCTFNFDNDVLNSTSEGTRRQYVRKFLKSFNCQYIANIDYGSKDVYIDRKGNTRQGTEREHYHALIQIDKMPKDSWPHGFDYYERVRLKQKSSPVRISKYISKLTNHAIKESTRRCAIIYSRTRV